MKSTKIYNSAIQQKCLLLMALSIDGSKAQVPAGEETYYFMYPVKDINTGGITATLKYKGKYIEDGCTTFKCYPSLEDTDYSLKNYPVALIKEDNKLDNKYLGIVNNKANDLHDVERKNMKSQREVPKMTFKTLTRRSCRMA
jgi:hypothetical protein